jgi:protein-S-isoprenylcysteine O-methyltransferase Ste14
MEFIFRWSALGVLLSAIVISGVHRYRARQQGETIARSRESGLLIAGRLLGALPLFGGVIAYVLNPAWMAWGSFVAPGWLRWIGVGLGAAVVPAVHWVLSTLGRNVSETVLTKSDHQLITGGPYQWVRHPLYTTGSTLFVALGLIAANWFILGMGIAAAVLIRTVVIPREESELQARFGPAYEDLRQRTGAMLPRMSDP